MLLLFVWSVDLLLEQLQRQRRMAAVRVRVEREKKLVEWKIESKKRQEAAGSAPADYEPPYMKPATDKLGRTIERPQRPL